MATQMVQHAKTSGKVGGVVVAALISAYFSYRSSKVEAEAKVGAAKAKAEAGYEVLAKTVTDIQASLLAEQRYSSQLEGRVKALEQGHPPPTALLTPGPALTPTPTPAPAAGVGIGSIGTIGRGAGGGTGSGFGSGAGRVRHAPAVGLGKPEAPPMPSRPDFKPKALPKNLDEAQQKRAAF